MDEQRQDDQLKPIYNSSVPIQDIALKTYLEKCKRVSKRGSGRSVLAVRHDDDDEATKISLLTHDIRNGTYVFIYLLLTYP